MLQPLFHNYLHLDGEYKENMNYSFTRSQTLQSLPMLRGDGIPVKRGQKDMKQTELFFTAYAQFCTSILYYAYTASCTDTCRQVFQREPLQFQDCHQVVDK